MTPEILYVLNSVSIFIIIIGAIIGTGFHLEKRANTRMEQLECKIERNIIEFSLPKEKTTLPDLREIDSHYGGRMKEILNQNERI